MLFKKRNFQTTVSYKNPPTPDYIIVFIYSAHTESQA